MIEDEHKTDFTASVGVNLTHDLSIGNAMAESALPDEGGNGGTGFGDLNCPPRLAAFSVYYDETSKSLKMVDPQVVVCGKEVKCDALSNVEDGIYYCNVRRNTSSNEYEAKVENTKATDSADSKAVCSVKLFELEGEEFTQYHAGVIALYDIGAKLVVQGKESTGSVTLDASGNSPKLSIVKDGKSITIDESVLESGDESEMSIKTIKWPKKATEEDSSTTSSTHILAGKDIDILDLTGTDYSQGMGISIKDSTDKTSKEISNTGVLSISSTSNEEATGKISIEAETNSGLEFAITDSKASTGTDSASAKISLDLKGRDEKDEFAIKSITYKGTGTDGTTETTKTLKVLGSGDDVDLSDLGGSTEIKESTDSDNIIKVTPPTDSEKAYVLKVPKGVTKITSGSGITLSANTGEVKISATGTATSGATKTIIVLTSVGYDTSSHELTMTVCDLAIQNGLITSVSDTRDIIWHTAVAE